MYPFLATIPIDADKLLAVENNLRSFTIAFGVVVLLLVIFVGGFGCIYLHKRYKEAKKKGNEKEAKEEYKSFKEYRLGILFCIGVSLLILRVLFLPWPYAG